MTIASTFPDKSLRQATVQEIQLELIRRSQFNAFDGERVVASLLANQKLWESVVLERRFVNRDRILPAMGHIKLRDLRDNIWNADLMHILVHNATCAKKLKTASKKDRWLGEFHVFTDQDDLDAALGGPSEGRVIVQVWWD